MASTAQFCPACGASTNPSGREVTGVVAATTATRKALIPAMVAALIVLVIVVAILVSKAHQSVIASQPLPAPVAPSVLAVPPAAPPVAPPITNAPSQPAPKAPAVTNAPSKKPPVLPAEDARYLAFLQQIEQRRVALDNDPSAAEAMMGSVRSMQSAATDPEQQGAKVNQGMSSLDQGYSAYQGKYQTLIRDFRSVQPPVDCTEIANKYFAALTDYADIISKTQVILRNIHMGSTPDYGALMQAQGVLQEAQTKVGADLSGADNAMQALCTHYGVPKPFQIQIPGAASPLTGL